MSTTCHITGYGPWSLDASQTSTLTPLPFKLTVLQSISFLMPYSSFSWLHCDFCDLHGHTSSHCPKYIAARSYARTRHPVSKWTVNHSLIILHSQNIIECARTAPTFETSSFMHQLASSFDWNTDSGATSHMTPHRHWIRNYRPLRLPIRLADDLIVYSAGVGSVVFNPTIRGKTMRPVEFTRVLHVPDLKSNLLSILYLTRHKQFTIHINSD